MTESNGDSSGNGVTNAAKTGGVMVSNRGGGSVFISTYIEFISTTVLDAVSFPAYVTSDGVVVVLMVVVFDPATADATVVVASKILALLGGCTAQWNEFF